MTLEPRSIGSGERRGLPIVMAQIRGPGGSAS